MLAGLLCCWWLFWSGNKLTSLPFGASALCNLTKTLACLCVSVCVSVRIHVCVMCSEVKRERRKEVEWRERDRSDMNQCEHPNHHHQAAAAASPTSITSLLFLLGEIDTELQERHSPPHSSIR